MGFSVVKNSSKLFGLASARFNHQQNTSTLAEFLFPKIGVMHDHAFLSTV
jgi:hypothetical protein